jgi:chromate transporter
MENRGELRMGDELASHGDAARPSLARLFASFLRLGLTAFGGPAMVAYIRDLSVNRKRWLDPETFKTGTILAQSIPGATAMQVAAYVGLRTGGVSGGLASYIGFALPAFVLMVILSSLYAASRNLPWVASLFAGLQVIVVAVVANATYTFGRASVKRVTDAVLAAAAALAFWLGLSPFYVILGAAIAGMLIVRTTTEPLSKGAQGEMVLPLTSVLGILLIILGGFIGLYFANASIFRLASLMLRIDLFAFGGGFASVPLMLHQVVDVRGLMDQKTFMDGIALGQVTPGPIVITATFVGYLLHGLLGAVVATVAIFTPSFVLLVVTAPFFERLKHFPIFTKATHGILASFVGLLLYVTIKFSGAIPWDIIRVCLVVATLGALLKKIDLIYIVLITAVLSVVLF